MKKEYLIIFIIQITETLGFSLILPLLPFYAQSLGATPFQIGLILTSFSLCQFISSPILGHLSDHYGRKPLLIFSQLSTLISFIVLGFADTLYLIFLSRIIDGILGSNFTIAQAYLSDISSKKNRSKVFGLSGVAFGIGFLIGPAIGGFLSKIDYSIPAFLAGFFSLITIFTTSFFLKETVEKKEKIKISLKIFHFQRFKYYFSKENIRQSLIILFTYLLGHVIWVSNSALFAKKQLNFGPSQMGYVLAYIGFLSIILRGFLLGKLINLFQEIQLQKTAIILAFTGLLVSSFASNWKLFMISLTFFAVGAGLLRPLLLGDISRQVSSKKQGEILGITNSLDSFSRIIGPMIGGAIINFFKPCWLGIIASFFMFVSLFLILKTKNLPLSQEGDKAEN